MATVQEAVRRLTIESVTRGVKETIDQLKQLQKAQGDVTVTSQGQERATQSMEKRLESLRLRYDHEYRAARDLEKVQRDLARARGQGILTTSEHIRLLQLATVRHNEQSAAMQAATSQAQNYAMQAGAVGQVLMRLGPGGLAAAAGVGVLALALKAGMDSANRFADDMGRLGDMSETLGLTTAQLQAINDAGAKFALTEERIGGVLQRFTAQMYELRNGSGELLDVIRGIDPALAREMMGAKDTAVAIGLLAQAYERAGDSRQKLDRVVGGRNGGTIGLLFREIGAQGGVGSITGEFEKTGDAINKELIERVRILKREIDDMSQDAQRNLESIYSEKTLQAQKFFVEKFLDFSRAAKDFSMSESLGRLLAVFGGGVKLPSTEGGGGSGWGGAGTTASTKLSVPQSGDIGNWYSGTANTTLSLEAQLKLQREFTAAMGSSATASDRLRARQLELGVALEKNVINQDQYNRALGMERTQEALTVLSRRIGLLGELASSTEVARQKQLEINLANAQGAQIDREQAAAIIAKAQRQAEYAKLPNQIQFERDQIGRTDMEATIAARLRSAGEPIDLSSAIAQQIRFNEQLRLSKDLTTEFATGFARDFMSQLRDGASAWDAFANAGANALQRLSDKLIDMAVQNLVAKAFGGIANSGFFGIGSSFMGSGSQQIGVTYMHSGGIVGIDGVRKGWVHSAYVEQASRAHAGADLRSDEVFAVLQRGERVIPKGGSDRGAMQIDLSDNRVIHIGQGASAQTVAQLRAELARDRAERRAQVLSIVKDAKATRQI